MELFNKTEIIVMLSIFGGMILIITLLTILDLIDERKEKKKAKLVNKSVDEEKKPAILS